jgi:hypothetical protein
MVNRSRGKAAAAIAGLILLAVTVSVANAEPAGSSFGLILFTQQDAVQAFDLVTGKGYQIGTATGIISGTTFVEFQFAPAGPPVGDELLITFQNKVIITDIDGDQIFFDNNGTGSFHLGVPGFGFQGSGGPLTGTYVVTGATGKYQSEHGRYHRWAVGSTFRYRAITTNPPSPPGALGTVYVEISREDRHR